MLKQFFIGTIFGSGTLALLSYFLCPHFKDKKVKINAVIDAAKDLTKSDEKN